MVATFFSMQHPIHPKAGVIKELRDLLGASNRDIGKKANVPYNLINKYLAGLMKPHDDGAFDRMELALHQIQREKQLEGTLPVSFGKGIRVAVVEPNVDTKGIEVNNETGVYSLDLTLFSVKPVGTPWGRKVTTRAITGLAERGDFVVLDCRKAEPGHVVEAYIDGEPVFGVLAGKGRSLRLRFTAEDFSDLPIDEKQLRGVVIARHETRANDVKAQFEYPHGMTIADKA